MATYTNYKSLEKPLSTEKYNVAVANKNNDVIDSELHKLDLKNQSQDELLATKESLNSEIARATTKENDIVTNLTSEIERAKSAENTNANNLLDEITRATIAEEAMSQVIKTKADQEELENYLPLTGGTIEGNAFVPLYIKNSSGSGVGSGAGIVLANDDGNLLNIQGIQKSDGDSYLRIFDFRKSPFTCLLEISNASKKVYDHKTNNLKEVLVEGDALPSTGGTISSQNFVPLVLKRESVNPVGLQLANANGSLLNIQVSLSGDTRIFAVYDVNASKYLFWVSIKERKIYDYKTNELKEIIVKGDDIGDCVVNGKKLSEMYSSQNNTDIIYSDSQPETLSTGMTWIGN